MTLARADSNADSDCCTWAASLEVSDSRQHLTDLDAVIVIDFDGLHGARHFRSHLDLVHRHQGSRGADGLHQGALRHRFGFVVYGCRRIFSAMQDDQCDAYGGD